MEFLRLMLLLVVLMLCRWSVVFCDLVCDEFMLKLDDSVGRLWMFNRFVCLIWSLLIVVMVIGMFWMDFVCFVVVMVIFLR